jgi:hypothetical protein
MTAASAVWVLVDTYDGSIIADEVVALESLSDIARATARSIQTFALQSDRTIDGVRLVWSDDARQQGIRLRTKLRLFGFDTVETVTEEAAREGRNRTARHIAPHMVLAYGAARADLDDADGKGGVVRLLAARAPHHDPDGWGEAPTMAHRVASVREAGEEVATRVSDRVREVGATLSRPTYARVAGVALVAAVSGVVAYALIGSSPSSAPTSPSVAEAVAPAPVPGAAPGVLQPGPQAVVPPPPAVPQAVPVSEPAVSVAVPEVAQMPEYASVPTVVDDAETALPDVTSVAEVVDVVEVPVADTPAVHGLGSTAPAQSSTGVGAPHLSGAGPAAGPVQPVGIPAQASPEAVQPAPPEPAGPMGSLLRALP